MEFLRGSNSASSAAEAVATSPARGSRDHVEKELGDGMVIEWAARDERESDTGRANNGHTDDGLVDATIAAGLGLATAATAATVGRLRGRAAIILLLIFTFPTLCIIAVAFAAWMHPGVELVDSAGTVHMARLHKTINFSAPILSVGLLGACSSTFIAHLWFTLMNIAVELRLDDPATDAEGGMHASRRQSTTDRNGEGIEAVPGASLHHRVEIAAKAALSLTGWEICHFFVGWLSILLLVVHLALDRQYTAALGWGLLPFLMVFLQKKYKLFGRPRSAIVFYRGRETKAFALWAMQSSLMATFLVVIAVARCSVFWIQQPVILPVDHPPQAEVQHPVVLDGALTDVIDWLTCRGHRNMDAETNQTTPWVAYVMDCDPKLFMDNTFSDTKANALLPTSTWDGRVLGQYLFANNIFGALLELLLMYQFASGQGLLAQAAQKAQLEWNLVVAMLIIVGLLFLILAQTVALWSEYGDFQTVCWLASFYDTTGPVLMITLGALLWKDTIEQLIRFSPDVVIGLARVDLLMREALQFGESRWSLGLDSEYCCFLSHFKLEAASDARIMKDKLGDILGAPVFLDSDDLMDLRALTDAVKRSDVLILLQTRGLLTRPWCLVEIHTAISANIPIVAVHINGTFKYDFEEAQQFMENFEVELERRNPGAGELLRQHDIDVVELGRMLREHIPQIISKTCEQRCRQRPNPSVYR